MQNDVTQVFYFHADANSVGGYLEEPFRYVHTPCSVSLSSTGGSTTSEAKHFGFEDGVKVRKAYTHASGRPHQKNGPWSQRVVSVVEGFSLLGRITAERMVAQMFIEQPAAGKGPRKISFAGSSFVDLRIDGRQIKPTLDATLLPTHHRDVDAYNQDASFTPELGWNTLTDYAKRQGVQRFAQTKDVPDWVRARFGWIGATNDAKTNEGYTLCSLVNQVEGVTSGQSYAHAIELPDVGRLFLGEITIFPQSANITMFRAELGCNTSGQVSIASGGLNGTMMPPNAFGG
jgi:hypothetical protein